MDKLESGDILIVTKLDRFGRDAIDVSTTVRTLAEMGVRVVWHSVAQISPVLLAR